MNTSIVATENQRQSEGVIQYQNAATVALLITLLGTPCTSSSAQSQFWQGKISASTSSSYEGLPENCENRPGALTANAIAEIRRLTGLTWGQIAEIFDVSRRTIHFWASGKPL